jgi:hypothetical protein
MSTLQQRLNSALPSSKRFGKKFSGKIPSNKFKGKRFNGQRKYDITTDPIPNLKPYIEEPLEVVNVVESDSCESPHQSTTDIDQEIYEHLEAKSKELDEREDDLRRKEAAFDRKKEELNRIETRLVAARAELKGLTVARTAYAYQNNYSYQPTYNERRYMY